MNLHESANQAGTPAPATPQSSNLSNKHHSWTQIRAIDRKALRYIVKHRNTHITGANHIQNPSALDDITDNMQPN